MARLLKLWFRFDEAVGRREYFWSGVFLMALKLGVDAAVVYAVTGRWWSPLQYVTPLLSTRFAAINKFVGSEFAKSGIAIVSGERATPRSSMPIFNRNRP